VVLVVKDVLLCHVRLGEHGVALAEIPLAGAEIVAADGVTVLVAVLVLDELADTSVTMLLARAFQAVLVSFANGVEGINWWTVTGIGHWAITKNKTVAAICPVLALIEITIVVFHHIDQL